MADRKPDKGFTSERKFDTISFDRANDIYEKLALGPSSGGEGPFRIGHYSLMAQSFMDKIADSVKRSRFFNKNQIELLAEKISSRFKRYN